MFISHSCYGVLNLCNGIFRVFMGYLIMVMSLRDNVRGPCRRDPSLRRVSGEQYALMT